MLSCTKNFINFRKNQISRSKKTEQADNPLLRYVLFIPRLCILLLLWGFGFSRSLLCIGITANESYVTRMEHALRT